MHLPRQPAAGATQVVTADASLRVLEVVSKMFFV
jgi:hypothetical protein